MTDAFVPKNVQQAAVFLDRRLPGWEGYINLSELDMDSSYRCILGQLWQSYPEFAGRTWGAWSSPYSQLRGTLNVSGRAFADYGDKWRKAITLRLALPTGADWRPSTEEVARPESPLPSGQHRLEALLDASQDADYRELLEQGIRNRADWERLRRMEQRIAQFRAACEGVEEHPFTANMFARDVAGTLQRIQEDREDWQ